MIYNTISDGITIQTPHSSPEYCLHQNPKDQQLVLCTNCTSLPKSQQGGWVSARAQGCDAAQALQGSLDSLPDEAENGSECLQLSQIAQNKNKVERDVK